MVLSAFGFRMLLIASWVVGLLAVVFDWLVPEVIPAALRAERALLDVAHSDAYLLLHGAIAAVASVGLLVSFYGLYTFKLWAPRLTGGLTLVTLALTAANGPYVHSGWAEALGFLASYLWGAVVWASFGSAYRLRFKDMGR